MAAAVESSMMSTTPGSVVAATTPLMVCGKGRPVAG